MKKPNPLTVQSIHIYYTTPKQRHISIHKTSFISIQTAHINPKNTFHSKLGTFEKRPERVVEPLEFEGRPTAETDRPSPASSSTSSAGEPRPGGDQTRVRHVAAPLRMPGVSPGHPAILRLAVKLLVRTIAAVLRGTTRLYFFD